MGEIEAQRRDYQAHARSAIMPSLKDYKSHGSVRQDVREHAALAKVLLIGGIRSNLWQVSLLQHMRA